MNYIEELGFPFKNHKEMIGFEARNYFKFLGLGTSTQKQLQWFSMELTLK